MTGSRTWHQECLARIREMLLLDWDPIGIAAYPEARDEYDAYVYPIFNLLEKDPDADVIFHYLWELETGYMGLDGNRFKTLQFAYQLLDLSRKMQEWRKASATK